MNAERLLAHFERISEAPDAIARLRRFILDLAVRGKLVEQDPEDEPVPLLLDEIKSRMRRLRLNHAFSVIDHSEIPFDEPSGWTWCRLGEVCEKTGSGSTPRGGKDVYKKSGVPFLRSQNIYDEGLRLEDVAFIDDLTHERMAGTRVLPCDLLLNITGGSIGRCAKVPLDFGEANISQHVAIIRVAARGMEEFLHSLILSPYFQGFVDNSQTGAGRGGLPKNRMDAIPVPLPPLAEQHRIVAKVDELMALCDQLEAARQQGDQGRERLLAATLQRLNQPAEDPASFRKDASFALQVLPSLTTTPAQIKQLRQTILNLAVRGKLVEQDPEDEPAEELLASFAEAKVELRKSTGDARIKIEDAPSPEALPWSLPVGWMCQSFQNLFLFIDYRGNTPPKTNDGVPLITAKNVRMGRLEREPQEFLSQTTFEKWMTRGFPRVGDLFFTTEAPLGNVCLNDINEPFALAQRVICLQPYADINTKFIMFALMSDLMQFMIGEHATGLTAKGIKAAKLKPLPIPLPPLAEQHRIVAKVDELMALCDQLEQQLSQADQQRRRLLEAVLAEALGGKLPTEQEESHAAVA